MCEWQPQSSASYPLFYVIYMVHMQTFSQTSLKHCSGIFSVQSPSLLTQFFFTFEHMHELQPSKSYLLPLQLLLNEILQCLIIDVMTFLQAVFQSTKM